MIKFNSIRIKNHDKRKQTMINHDKLMLLFKGKK